MSRIICLIFVVCVVIGLQGQTAVIKCEELNRGDTELVSQCEKLLN